MNSTHNPSKQLSFVCGLFQDQSKASKKIRNFWIFLAIFWTTAKNFLSASLSILWNFSVWYRTILVEADLTKVFNMSYILHPAAKTSTRAYFKDFSLAYLWNGPSKIAHVFTVVGATIPFYLFSSAYHGAKKSRTIVKLAIFWLSFQFHWIWLHTPLCPTFPAVYWLPHF